MSDWPWKHFTREEMQCKCGCGKAPMVPAFMDKLEELRTKFRKPLIVSSGYRCPEYNAQVSGTGLTGPHTTGRAVDFQVSGSAGVILLSYAAGMAFTGLGFKQHGPHSGRFIHLDDIVEGPRPNIWSYP